MSYWRVTAGAWPDQVLYMSMRAFLGGRVSEIQTSHDVSDLFKGYYTCYNR